MSIHLKYDTKLSQQLNYTAIFQISFIVYLELKPRGFPNLEQQGKGVGGGGWGQGCKPLPPASTNVKPCGVTCFHLLLLTLKKMIPLRILLLIMKINLNQDGSSELCFPKARALPSHMLLRGKCDSMNYISPISRGIKIWEMVTTEVQKSTTIGKSLRN